MDTSTAASTASTTISTAATTTSTTVIKRPKADELRTRAATVSGGGRPQTVLRPMSMWFKETRKRPAEEEIERQSKIIDGIEKMLKIVPEEDEDRMVQLYYELLTARATLNALQEARPMTHSSSRTRTLTIEKISLPVHWWATVTQRERTSFHFFLLFQVDSQVRYTSLVTLHGAEAADELVFDETIKFDSVTHGWPLLAKVYACKTVRKEAVTFSATPKKKAMELAHSVASRLQHTPRKLLERLTHGERRQDETLLADTPRRRTGLDFALIGTVTMCSATLVASPQVVELQMEGADAYPIGSTLCCRMQLTRNESDVVRHEGFLTLFEHPLTSAGVWVRRRVLLDGGVLRCFPDVDTARGEAAQPVDYDLAHYPGAEVRKVPRSDCARLNSFAIVLPGPAGNEVHMAVKMAADSKESRDEWLQRIAAALDDLAAWSQPASEA